MEGCVFIFVAILVVAVIVSTNRGKERERARRAYQDALARLKRDPANPNLREETLRLGRVYSNLTRNGRGVTVFDEVALSNDIGAATAAASRPQQAQLGVPKPSVEARLAQLGALRAKGLIDDSEYAARRSEILKEI